jgi:hypothetical protein
MDFPYLLGAKRQMMKLKKFGGLRGTSVLDSTKTTSFFSSERFKKKR